MTQELNEKLAKWAGFTPVHSDIPETSELFWDLVYPPNYKNFLQMGKLPDFTSDLSACFKWLVPVALKKGYDTHVWSDDGYWFAHLVTNDRYHKQCFYNGCGEDEASAALCHTYENLIIDSESNTERITCDSHLNDKRAR